MFLFGDDLEHMDESWEHKVEDSSAVYNNPWLTNPGSIWDDAYAGGADRHRSFSGMGTDIDTMILAENIFGDN